MVLFKKITLIVLLASACILYGCTEREMLKISIKEPANPDNIHYVSIEGSVKNPGLFPFYREDTFQSLLNSAGGTISSDKDYIILLTVTENNTASPQKIDINRADSWLLEALPNIGEDKAQAIIEYRQTCGPFETTFDITRVNGIGLNTYESIKQFITVSG